MSELLERTHPAQRRRAEAAGARREPRRPHRARRVRGRLWATASSSTSCLEPRSASWRAGATRIAPEARRAAPPQDARRSSTSPSSRSSSETGPRAGLRVPEGRSLGEPWGKRGTRGLPMERPAHPPEPLLATCVPALGSAATAVAQREGGTPHVRAATTMARTLG